MSPTTTLVIAGYRSALPAVIVAARDQGHRPPARPTDLTRGQAYVERGIEAFEAISRDKQLCSLRRKAAQLGVSIIISDVPTAVC